MSEKSKSAEMDDVLSSVRRLVTHNAQAPEAPSAATEKLLLTPSFLVEREKRDEAPFVHAEEEPAATAKVLNIETPVNGAPLEDKIATLEAAVSAQTGEWEPDGSESGDLETPRTFVFTHTPREPLNLDDYEAPEPSPSADPQPAPEAEAVEAEPAPVMAGKIAATQNVTRAVREAVKDAIEAEVPRAVEAAVAEEAVKAEAADTPNLGDGTAETEKPELGSIEFDEDPQIDEAMLRDMVAEIVRQELQGALGERITRNVRKLVRREIHRAIMTRDFG